MIGRARQVLPLVSAVLILAPHTLWSQGSAYLTGFVRDPSGASIPAASVVIKDDNTGVTHELKTTETGLYRSPALQPGDYELRVSAAGFQDSVIRGLEVLLGQPRSFDV